MATAKKIGEVLANVEIFGVPTAPGMPPQTTATLQIRQDLGTGSMALPFLKGEKGDRGPSASISSSPDYDARTPAKKGDILFFDGAKWKPITSTNNRAYWNTGLRTRTNLSSRMEKIYEFTIPTQPWDYVVEFSGQINLQSKGASAVCAGVFVQPNTVDLEHCVAMAYQYPGKSGPVSLNPFRSQQSGFQTGGVTTDGHRTMNTYAYNAGQRFYLMAWPAQNDGTRYGWESNLSTVKVDLRML